MAFNEDFKPIPLKDTPLLTPITVGAVTLQNRIAYSPCNRLRNPNYIPSDLTVEYYAQRAMTHGTLLIAEGTAVSPSAGGYPGAPGIWSDEQIAAWRRVFDGVHARGSFIFHQIFHMGRQSNSVDLGAKGFKFYGATDDLYMDEASKTASLAANNPLRGLTRDQIKEVINDHVQAAKNSLKAGSDGIELHAANGFLHNQFLDSTSNQRTDEYGGSIENRARFVLETVDAIVEAIGAEKLGLRISPYGTFGNMSGISDPNYLAQYAYLVGELEKRALKGKRLAYIHILEPRALAAAISDEVDPSLENSTEWSDFIYTVWKGVVIRAGDYGRNPEVAQRHSEKPNTIIAYGRFFISNPDLVERLQHGYKLTAYDRNTFYTHTKDGYTDYKTYKEILADQTVSA